MCQLCVLRERPIRIHQAEQPLRKRIALIGGFAIPTPRSLFKTQETVHHRQASRIVQFREGPAPLLYGFSRDVRPEDESQFCAYQWIRTTTGPLPPQRRKMSAPSGLWIVFIWKLDGKEG